MPAKLTIPRITRKTHHLLSEAQKIDLANVYASSKHIQGVEKTVKVLTLRKSVVRYLQRVILQSSHAERSQCTAYRITDHCTAYTRKIQRPLSPQCLSVSARDT